MEFLWSALSFVCGVVFTLGVIELLFTLREDYQWYTAIDDKQRAKPPEEDRPSLNRYV